MNPRKRPLYSTDLFLANPATRHRSRDLLHAVYTSPFTSCSAYRAHHSCVNALAISAGEGRWLASGGDDKRVLLHEALANDDDGTLGEPKAYYEGAQSNIFAIDFACDGQKLFSTGNDAAIICHDLETSAESTTSRAPGRPAQVWIDNDDSIHGLACHPTNPHLFLSASSDGTLRQYDTRADTNAVALLADAHEMEGVAYHPLQPDLFAYSGEDAHAGLVDARMAWTGPSSSSRGRTPTPRVAREVAVVNWQANLVAAAAGTTDSLPTRRTRRARPAASSLAFSPTGNLVALTLAGHFPTLYALSSPSPLATFSASSPPSLDGSRVPPSFPTSYRNACTTKHGSFGGGPNAREGQGLFYAAGSDDFGVYVWEVPSREKMELGRRSMTFGDGHWPSGAEGIGYLSPSTSSSPASLTLPHSLSEPSSVLRAHRSIANTTLYHPTLPYLYSCGVEKTIVRHSPAPASSAHVPASARRARTSPPASSKWQYTARVPRAEPASFLSSLFGPPLDRDLDPVAGETDLVREERLRAEDTAVLEYFDELIVSEMDDDARFWRTAREGEVDGGGDSDGRGAGSGDSSDESFGELRTGNDNDDEEGEDDSDDTDDEERIEAQGNSGTTRRILNSIYALEGIDSSDEDGSEGGEDEDASQASLTVSEEEEYRSLMQAWDDRAPAGEDEDDAAEQ
ncbi:hypothetical protein JCM11491_002448 [Sporobolomyces phaffii]